MKLTDYLSTGLTDQNLHNRLQFPVTLWVAILILAGGCGGPAPQQSADQIVYVCRETGTAFVGSSRETPAINPQTGNATLVRGLYCSKCQKWNPVPPQDVFSGNPLSRPCPKHKIPVSWTGPVPSQAVQLDGMDSVHTKP